MQNFDPKAQEVVMEAASAIVERAVDDEIERLDNVMNDEQELAKLRKKRIAEMKQAQEKKGKWKSLGHGKLTELTDQKDFFQACQESERVVAIFTTPNSEHGATLSQHLEAVASKHQETRFLKLDAEKSPFLVEKLKIWMMPSTVLIKNEKCIHVLLGLQEISPSGQYDTWLVERVLFEHEMVSHQDIEELARAELLDQAEDL